MIVDKGEPYDRHARRLEANRSTADADAADPNDRLGADDQVARATYPDPKARHIALTEGSEVLDEKRELAADVSTNVDGATVAELADAAGEGPTTVKGKRKTGKG
jgi:parvulin-like peptidyl-prolyl isomerase